MAFRVPESVCRGALAKIIMEEVLWESFQETNKHVLVCMLNGERTSQNGSASRRPKGSKDKLKKKRKSTRNTEKSKPCKTTKSETITYKQKISKVLFLMLDQRNMRQR